MRVATAAVAATGGLGWVTHDNVAGAEEVSPFDMPTDFDVEDFIASW